MLALFFFSFIIIDSFEYLNQHFEFQAFLVRAVLSVYKIKLKWNFQRIQGLESVFGLSQDETIT